MLGAGAILGGMVLGAIGAFVVDRKYVEASCFAAAGAVLTFFGFMHGETVGFAVTPTVALAYAMVAAFLFALSRLPAEAAVPAMTNARRQLWNRMAQATSGAASIGPNDAPML